MTIRIRPNARLSEGIVANGFLLLSGLTARDKINDVKAQTRDVLQQIDELLAEAGCTKADLVSVQIWLANIFDFDAMNSVWENWVDGRNPPTRATVESKLAGSGSLVEMKATAAARRGE
jgi:enamine deaminase RidA (YjgF/YER057c/UK114 family)